MSTSKCHEQPELATKKAPAVALPVPQAESRIDLNKMSKQVVEVYAWLQQQVVEVSNHVENFTSNGTAHHDPAQEKSKWSSKKNHK